MESSRNNNMITRVDALEKVTGQIRYAADYSQSEMLFGAFLFSSHRHAYIRGIKKPKTGLVLTGADIPISHVWNNFPIICRNKVRSFGDVVAIAAAATYREAVELLNQVAVEYEPIPADESIADSLNGKTVIHDAYPDNCVPGSHYVVHQGESDALMREAKTVFRRQYRTQSVEHAYIEPEAVLAIPGPNFMKIIASMQYPYSTRRVVAEALGLPMHCVEVIQPAIGGSFGGKEESSGLLSVRAALLAKAAGKPVKIELTREESILISSKRHPFQIDYEVGLDANGDILCWKSVLRDDCGPYNARARNMNWRASVHAAGPYRARSWSTDVKGVYTNNLISGAMRGYSSPQIIFAHESLIDEIACTLGQDPLDYRRQICFKTGDITATGQSMGELPFLTMLDMAEAKFKEWEMESSLGVDKGLYVLGKGLAIATRGCGLGAEYPDATGAQITLMKDGSILLQSSLSEIGQGLQTALSQIVCDVLQIDPCRLRFPLLNTQYMEDGSSTVASRGTYVGGKAMLKAAQTIHDRLLEYVALEYGCEEESARLKDGLFYCGGHTLTFDQAVALLGKYGQSHSAFEWFTPERVVINHVNGQGNAYPDYTNTCVCAMSAVNRLTGRVTVRRVCAIHDVGHIIHRGSIINQVMGGVAMGLGFALMEECTITPQGLKSANLDSYLIPTSMDMPSVEVELIGIPGKYGPFGAKSLGEPATEAVGAAIARSVANGLGICINTLPLTPERIVRYLQEQESNT